MSIFSFTLIFAMAALSICMVLIAIRFAIGPTLPDRITSFDLLVANIIGIMAIYTELTGNVNFIDVAIILSLFGFLGSISFAYYLMKSTR